MNIQIVLIFTIAPVQHKEEFIQQGTFIICHSFLFIENFFSWHISVTLRDNGLDGFGIHTINCTQHPYGDIGLPEMEEIIQAKYGDFSKYDAFMDDNMGFWSNDLDPFLLAFIVSVCFCFWTFIEYFFLFFSPGRWNRIYASKMVFWWETILQYLD